MHKTLFIGVIVVTLLLGAAMGCTTTPSAETTAKPATDGPSLGHASADPQHTGVESTDSPAEPQEGAPAVEGGPGEREPTAAEPSREVGAEAESPGASEDEQEPEWLIDDEGREYYIDPIEKRRGHYQFVEEGRVILHGVPVEIAGHDEDRFYVKVFRTPDASSPFKGRKSEPTPEELEAVAETYRFDVSSGNRLELEPFDDGLPKRGLWRNGFDIADMDGDGHLDIVHGPPRKSRGIPVIFRGDGEGGWSSWLDLTFPRRYDYGDAAVADFDGDGLPDLALGIHLQGVQVLIHDGEGGFEAWSEGLDYQVAGEGTGPGSFSSRAIEAGDWNQDGLPDLIALGEGPHPPDPDRPGTESEKKLFVIRGPTIYLNQGDGTWEKRTQNETDAEIFGDSIALADFDADGRPDFATGSSMMPRKDLVNLQGERGAWNPVTIPEVRRGYVRAVTAADFDGDGRDDLAVAYLSYELGTWRNGIDLLYSEEGGGWTRRPLFSREGRTALYALDHGDLDGDGALDLAAFDDVGAGFLWLGDGDGFFVREEAPELEPPSERCRSYHVRLADLDSDGRDEIVVNFADEANALLDPTLCPSGGGLSAWKAVPREESTSPVS